MCSPPKVTDNLAATTTSSAVNITVNQPPTVYADQPANNASFTAPASVTINATAADSDGTVSKVEFFQGAVKLGEDTTSPYSYSWTNVAAGKLCAHRQSYRQPGSHDNLECRDRHGQSASGRKCRRTVRRYCWNAMQFNGGGSFDSDGTISSYDWDFVTDRLEPGQSLRTPT